ncbi:MAG TPA: OmpA family protein [Telluria sp.]
MKKIALAAAMFCTSSVLMAQEAYVPTINPNWYIQPSFVGLKPDSDWGTDRDWGGGLKFGKAMSPAWDLQVGITHVRTDSGVRHYDQTTFGADALLMMSRKQFRPFLLLGIGLERDDLEAPLMRVKKTSPYVSAGLGFQIGISDRMSLQADIRQVHGRLRDDERFGFDRSNNRYLTFGLNYALGPTPQPPAPPAPPPAPEPVVAAPEAPAPAPAPAPARFEKITLAATELFEFDSARLQGSQPKLDEIASVLAADTSVTNIVISGHADRIGSEQYNQKLSEQRANAVREYLVGKGIDGGRLTAQGKGESMPVVTCTEKNRAALIKCLEPNRRVEVEQIVIERKVSE